MLKTYEKKNVRYLTASLKLFYLLLFIFLLWLLESLNLHVALQCIYVYWTALIQNIIQDILQIQRAKNNFKFTNNMFRVQILSNHNSCSNINITKTNKPSKSLNVKIQFHFFQFKYCKFFFKCPIMKIGLSNYKSDTKSSTPQK